MKKLSFYAYVEKLNSSTVTNIFFFFVSIGHFGKQFLLLEIPCNNRHIFDR